MPDRDTTVRFKADISKLKSEMQAAQRQVKLVNAEFKNATAGMDDWTKSEEGLAAKTKQLNGILESQQKKLKLLNEEYKKTVEVYGEGSAQADRVKIAILNQQAAISKTEKDLSDYNKQLKELPKTMDDVGDAADKAADGFTVFKGALSNLVADGVRTAINAMKDLAKEALNVGVDFEKSMSNVKAISGATAEQMQELTDKAISLSESSKFTASEIADGFSYMAMAGWKTKDMLDGIDGVMNLAAASGSDLAKTSDILTDALTAMGYSASDAGRLADVMAAASSNANTNVELMGSTFQYVAPVIGTLGMNMEDAAVAIGLMANAGIKGDKAGTALRSTLNRLSAPPKECAEEMEKLGLSLTDSDGKMKSLNQVIIELRSAFSNLSETEATAAAKHIAGAEAMSGLLAIVNASDKDFQKLTVAVNDSAGAAANMASTMQDNVGGKLTTLQSKIQSIMIKLFQRASESMKKGIETVTEALDKVNWDKAGDEVGKFATMATNFFAYLIKNSSTIMNVLKTMGTAFAALFIAQKISATTTAVTTLITAIKGASSASAILSSTMGALGISMSALPVMAVIAALGLLITYVSKVNQEMNAQAQANYGLSQSQEKLIDSVNASATALNNAAEARRSEGESIDQNYKKLENMKQSYNDLIDENGKVKSGCEDLAQTLLGQLADGLGTTIDKLKDNIDANGKLSASIDDLIEKKKLEAKFAAYEDDYNQALKDEYESWKNLKNAKEEQKTAQENLNDAQDRYNKAVAAYKDQTNLDPHNFLNMKQAEKDIAAAEETLNTLNQTVADSQNNWSQAQSTIENYEKAMASMDSNVQEAEDALSRMQGGIVNFGTATKQQLEDQVVATKKDLNEIRQAYAEGVVDETFVTNAEMRLNAAKAELDKFAENAGTAGTTASSNLTGSVSDGLSGLTGAIDKLGGNTYQTLQSSMGDWKSLGEEKTGDYLGVLNNKSGEASEAGSSIAQCAVQGIKDGSKEFKTAGEENSKEYIGGIESQSSEFKYTGNSITDWTTQGIQEKSDPIITAGNWTTQTYADAVKGKSDLANKAGTEIASQAAKGADSAKTEAETSGSNFSQGFINGIGSLFSAAFEAAKTLAKNAISGLKSGQQEGSPSKLTYQSGEFFGGGYERGIKSTKKLVNVAAGAVAKEAIASLKKAQKEGSPSKLTYESGKMFTQGFINGIGSLEDELVSTTKNLVTKALAELLRLKDFNFSEVAENASTAFSSQIQEQVNYMIDRISYQNQQQLKDFDTTIKQLQDASAEDVANAQAASEKKQEKLQKKIEKKQEKAQTKSTKKQIKNLQKQIKKEQEALSKTTENIQNTYEAQIEEQQKMKESYQQASSTMISQFTKAVQEYQTAAQKLIDDTMNAISSDYQTQYDALISKQDNLIQKMKEAGDLFNVSGAGVMTINDLQQQTQAIKEYASRLEKIKNKVSADLFDEIASYDIKEGNAFMDRLLAMSDAELKAYSDAFDEKMSVAESLSKDLYKSDFDVIANNYTKAMQSAFAGLPKQLEELGYQTMQGFLSGFTKNSDYMEESVKTFIAGMVDTFKKQLGIASPSKVTMALGELTGEGFADGILKMVKTVQEAAKDITSAVTESLDMSDTISEAKASIGSATGATGYNRNAGSFVGDRTQIINFNQVNNSPKSLDRLTIYRQTNNMLFNAKVGLSNV